MPKLLKKEFTERLTTKTLKVSDKILLESGKYLSNVNIRYSTVGRLNADKSNVVWVFHALTGSSDFTDWWDGFIAEGSPVNPEKDFVICANILGSCYGTTGPKNEEFPFITIGDIVSVHKILRNHLGISNVKLGIGGSMGGQQLLEWAIQEPTFFDAIVPLATNAIHSPWGIAFNEAQRMALGGIDKGYGLEVARAIAMLSYRHYDTFEATQKDVDGRWDGFKASSYQRYQGEKLRKRFTSETYVTLSKAMDSNNLGRNMISVEHALSTIKSKALVIGIDTDILFPIAEQEFLAKHIPNSKFEVVNSQYGHDGFLVETKTINQLIANFL